MDKVVPWSVARFLLVIGFVVVIAAGVALMAHGVARPRNCSRACKEEYAWTRLPVIEIFGICVGAGACFFGLIGGLLTMQRRRQAARTRDAISIE